MSGLWGRLRETVLSLKGLVQTDGIVNTQTGMGTGKDVSWAVEGSYGLPYETCAAMYRTIPYAKRAVDLPVNDALSRGYTIALRSGKDDAMSDQWTAEEKRLKVDRNVSILVKWARAYGASYGLYVTDDGENDLSLPLDRTKVKRLLQIIPLTSRECKPDRINLLASGYNGEFGMPTQYRISLQGNLRESLEDMPSKWAEVLRGQKSVHASRLVRVIGTELTREERLSGYSEGDSVLVRAFNAIAQTVGMDNAAAVLASEMKIDVLHIPGLEESGSGDGADAFEERLTLLQRGKSMLNVIFLGAGETFESRQGNVSGYAELKGVVDSAMMVASEIPTPIFYGKGSTGLSGSAGIESETYVSLLDALWKFTISDLYSDIYDLVRFQQKGPYASASPKEFFKIRPHSLRVEMIKDEYARRMVTVQTDAMAVGNGVLPRAYIRERYKAPGGWTFNMPEYDEKTWPPDPLPEKTSKASPNTEGKNAPGQIPSDTTPQEDPQGKGAVGVDLQTTLQNTGQRDGDDVVEAPPGYEVLGNLLKTCPETWSALKAYVERSE